MLSSLFLALVTFFVGYKLGQENWSPKQVFKLKPKTTEWKECTYCPKCEKVYSQGLLDESVYTCYGCGKETNYKSFRYLDGNLEITSRS